MGGQSCRCVVLFLACQPLQLQLVLLVDVTCIWSIFTVYVTSAFADVTDSIMCGAIVGGRRKKNQDRTHA